MHNKINIRKALIIAREIELALALPYLLKRAGFKLDIIAANKFFAKDSLIDDFEFVRDSDFLGEVAAKRNLDNYDLIVIADDNSLNSILHSNISLANKLKLLPVREEKDFLHIYSKIGLSQVFVRGGINTPAFATANNKVEAITAAENIGYPVMIKIDKAAGGVGVFECKNAADISNLASYVFEKKILVQKKIEGVELDLSGFYCDGKLVHFSYSIINKVINNKFGPSQLRTYFPLSQVDEKIFLEMKNLGSVLGSDGFTMVSCIQSNQDQKLYFFEADMRPNIWADITRFFNEDFALRIKNYFDKQEILQYSQLNNSKGLTILIPHFLRLKFWEILCNRYKVWRYIGYNEVRVMLRYWWYNEFLKYNMRRKRIKKWLFSNMLILNLILTKVFLRNHN